MSWLAAWFAPAAASALMYVGVGAKPLAWLLGGLLGGLFGLLGALALDAARALARRRGDPH